MTTTPMPRSTRSSPTTAYPRLRQALHWSSALGIAAMYPTGFIMARTLDDGLRLSLYQVHMLLGWLIVAFMVTRLVLRVRRPVPPPPGLTHWNLRLHTGVHWLANVMPLALALGGLAAIAQNDLLPALQAGSAPPATLGVTQARDAHMVGVYAYLALLVVHVAGVVRYQATRGDVLSRMGLRGVPSARRGR
jgi:cytochrome b561